MHMDRGHDKASMAQLRFANLLRKTTPVCAMSLCACLACILVRVSSDQLLTAAYTYVNLLLGHAKLSVLYSSQV